MWSWCTFISVVHCILASSPGLPRLFVVDSDVKASSYCTWSRDEKPEEVWGRDYTVPWSTVPLHSLLQSTPVYTPLHSHIPSDMSHCPLTHAGTHSECRQNCNEAINYTRWNNKIHIPLQLSKVKPHRANIIIRTSNYLKPCIQQVALLSTAAAGVASLASHRTATQSAWLKWLNWTLKCMV